MTYDWDHKLLELSPSMFVQFTRDIIADIPDFANARIIDGSGDRGRDIEAECFRPDPAGVTKTHQHWIIQCKRYGKMLGVDDLKDTILWADVHKPDVVVFASNNRLAPTASDFLEGQRKAKKFEIFEWTADAYKKLIFKHSAILQQYFPDMEIPKQYSDQLVEESSANFPKMMKAGVSKEVKFDLKTVDSDMIKQELKNIPDESVRALAHKAAGDALLMAKRYNEALSIYNYCLGMLPKYIAVLINKAFVLEKLGRREDAISCYEQVSEIEPNNKFAFNGIGHLLFAGGKIKSALLRFDKAIKADPKFIVARDNRSTALWALKKYRDAFLSLNETLKDEPMSLSTLAKKADFLSELHHYEEALTVLDVALAISPNNIILLNSKGHVLERMSHMDFPQPERKMKEALALFKKTVEMEPNFVMGTINEAVCLDATGDFEGATKLFDLALSKEPDNVHLWISKTNHAINSNKMDKALECAQRAIMLSKDTKYSVHAYLARARYYEKIGDFRGSIHDLSTAAKLDPFDPMVWISFCNIMQIEGDETRAKEYEKKIQDVQTHFDKIFEEIKDLV